MLAISVLGPLEVRRDGEWIAVPSGKSTEVLIRLALDAGAVVRTERLIDDLWGADAPATDRNTLQAKVSQLRRAIGGHAVVSGGRAGYSLGVHPDAVDALHVLKLADVAKTQLDAGQSAAAVASCTTALAMFRGEILRDAGDGDWLIPHRVRLEEVRLGLIEGQLAARLKLGATGEVVGELESLVLRHPLREGLWALLITALYRDGRQADALAAYRRVRENLADDLGLDPGPELQALEQGILARDPGLDAPPIAERPRSQRAPEPERVPGNLPALSSELFGRQSQLSELAELAIDNRLVTVIGPAGVGKTRLAIEVARRHRARDGAWLVRLDNARTVESLPQALGHLAQAEERFSDAVEHFELAVTAANELGISATEGFHLTNLGRALQLAGRNEEAITTYERAIEITRAVGLMRVVAVARVRLGRLRLAAGDTDAARSAVTAADSWFRASGGGDGALLAECLLAALDARAGVPSATQCLAHVLDSARAVGDLEVQQVAQEALAGVGVAAVSESSGNRQRAAR